MRRAGDVCFSQVFRDGSGEMLSLLCLLDFLSVARILFGVYVHM